MSYARQMLDACPRALTVDTGLLAATLEALNDCTEPLLGVCAAVVRAAATSANGMPGCMSTAGCAPRPAAVASRPAGSCWTRSNRKLGGVRIAGQDAVELTA